MKGYGCMRSLNQRGIHTIVASEYDRTPHFTSRYCAERARLPSPWNGLRAYKDALRALAARRDVETILPVRECDVYVLAKYADEFDADVDLMTPPFETVKAAHDRLHLAKTAARAGVPFARTRLLSEVDAWDTDVVIKSRFNLLTSEYVDSVEWDDAQEVKDIRFLPGGVEPDVDVIREAMGHDPIVQDFIPEGDKHHYCAIWANGEPLATYQHRQLRKNSWVGGGGVYRESTFSRAVADAAYDLLHALEWHGVVCLEYLRDAETGEWKFLEVNPRLVQSLPEAIRAKADFPYYYWLYIQDRAEEIDPDYDLGVKCHNLYGELGHLLSLVRDESPFVERPSLGWTVGMMAASCLRHPRFDYIRRDDLKLFFSCLREALRGDVARPRQYLCESGHPELGRPAPTTMEPVSSQQKVPVGNPTDADPIPARVSAEDLD